MSISFDPRKLSRADKFLLALAVAYLLPLGIPGFGIDETYFFIFVLVFFAWLILKWNSFESLTGRGTFVEIIVGVGAVVAIYAEKIALSSRLGLLDMVIIFSGLALAFFGWRSFKLFWVPAAYGIVLLLGYQVENAIPNYVALQDWMAGVLASSTNALGIATTTSGHIIALNSNSSTPLLLDVESDCTGIQGVLAFGLLSTMALLDVKPKLSRTLILFTIGFVGVFLINILRLLMVVLTFDFFGTAIGEDVHVYAGYILFVVWVLAFWSLAFRYLTPKPSSAVAPMLPASSPPPSTPGAPS
jgi:exosortase/archaeosortase family protein